MQITTIGLDLAKNVFHMVACNRSGKMVKKKQLRRSHFRIRNSRHVNKQKNLSLFPFIGAILNIISSDLPLDFR